MKMKKSMLGVTLLEIMLVLAVAAMIIVMSVRYYQSANSNRQATAALQQIQAIVASGDALSQASGDYSKVTTAALHPLLDPVSGLTTPWGTPITIDSQNATSYTIKLAGVPTGVCPLITARLTDAHLKPGVCTGADLLVEYIANPTS